MGFLVITITFVFYSMAVFEVEQCKFVPNVLLTEGLYHFLFRIFVRSRMLSPDQQSSGTWHLMFTWENWARQH